MARVSCSDCPLPSEEPGALAGLHRFQNEENSKGDQERDRDHQHDGLAPRSAVERGLTAHETGGTIEEEDPGDSVSREGADGSEQTGEEEESIDEHRVEPLRLKLSGSRHRHRREPPLPFRHGEEQPSSGANTVENAWACPVLASPPELPRATAWCRAVLRMCREAGDSLLDELSDWQPSKGEEQGKSAKQSERGRKQTMGGVA